ncbi:MAG TPA: L-threonylcarbamoyladenylate synthase [Polyangia bacterium]
MSGTKLPVGGGLSSRRVDVAAAVAALARGEIVAYPTETSYGLAVDAFSTAALDRLFALKGRGAEKTFSVIVAPVEGAGARMIDTLVAEVPPAAERLMAKFWPGPLTLVLPARSDLPAALVNNGFVAVRESPHPLARALAAGLGRAITATSANPAGQPAARSAEEVAAALPDGCWILDGGSVPGGTPSTLVRVTPTGLEIVRAGLISAEALAQEVSR